MLDRDDNEDLGGGARLRIQFGIGDAGSGAEPKLEEICLKYSSALGTVLYGICFKLAS